jgi:hypothetical protein
VREWIRGAPLAIGAAGALLALAGCGGDDVPDGFTQFEEDGVSIAYPESWRELPAPEGEQNVVLVARETGRPAEEAAQVTLTRVDEEAPFVALMSDVKVFNRNQLENASFAEERGVDVDGADEARLLVTDYELPADGRAIPYRARQVIALKEPDLQLNAGVTAPRDAYDRFDADAILDSLSID